MNKLILFIFFQGVQKRFAGHPSQCRPVDPLFDLHQREF